MGILMGYALVVALLAKSAFTFVTTGTELRSTIAFAFILVAHVMVHLNTATTNVLATMPLPSSHYRTSDEHQWHERLTTASQLIASGVIVGAFACMTSFLDAHGVHVLAVAGVAGLLLNLAFLAWTHSYQLTALQGVTPEIRRDNERMQSLNEQLNAARSERITDTATITTLKNKLKSVEDELVSVRRDSDMLITDQARELHRLKNPDLVNMEEGAKQ